MADAGGKRTKVGNRCNGWINCPMGGVPVIIVYNLKVVSFCRAIYVKKSDYANNL